MKDIGNRASKMDRVRLEDLMEYSDNEYVKMDID